MSTDVSEVRAAFIIRAVSIIAVHPRRLKFILAAVRT
jgi:hypothetical protein